MSENILHRAITKMRKICLQPIRVLCFHQVSTEYNPLTMWECDWTQIELFKQNMLHLKEQYTFISLPEAYEKLQHDTIRRKRYAVLTADDGYKSLLNILPWLEEQQIPVTLFVNTKYLDRKSWSAVNEEQALRAKADVDMLTEVCPDLYLSKEELFALTSPLITIGMHGHEHLDMKEQKAEDFMANVITCRDLLKTHPRYIPYFAYTWGHHTLQADKQLNDMGIIPVLVSGTKNILKTSSISRECIDGKSL